MKLIQYKAALLLATILIIGFSCSESSSQGEGSTELANNEEKETESGIAYQFIKNGSGEVPPEGGFWTMNIAYYNESGEKIFASEDQGGPIPLNYFAKNILKNASLEECFSLIGNGDSAVFYISADSLYKNSAHRPTPANLVGTKLKLCIGIENVFSTEQFVAHTEELERAKIEKEKETILAYISESDIEAEVTEEGLYYAISQPGSGERPLVGQTVMVNYTGYLLDGTIFDTSSEEIAQEAGVFTPGRPYGPIDFPLGQGRVIKGWDIGIGLLGAGGKAKFIIPSPLAYGSRSSGELIKANSILVFDVELVEIVE